MKINKLEGRKMKKEELKRKLKFLSERKVQELKKLSYQELKRIYLDNLQIEKYKEEGKIYQIEIQGTYDDGIGDTSQNLRIIIAVDLVGSSTFFPICSSFIITPKGKLNKITTDVDKKI